MIRLMKSGMIREVETAEAAESYIGIGYEVIDEEIAGEDEADGTDGTEKPSRGKGAGKTG